MRIRGLGTRMYREALRLLRLRIWLRTPPGKPPVVPRKPQHQPLEIDLEPKGKTQ